jgi:hypothetical protein
MSQPLSQNLYRWFKIISNRRVMYGNKLFFYRFCCIWMNCHFSTKVMVKFSSSVIDTACSNSELGLSQNQKLVWKLWKNSCIIDGGASRMECVILRLSYSTWMSNTHVMHCAFTKQVLMTRSQHTVEHLVVWWTYNYSNKVTFDWISRLCVQLVSQSVNYYRKTISQQDTMRN